MLHVRKKYRMAEGVTLTEVVVAAGILAIAMVPILKALTIAQTTGRRIETKTTSLILAQGKLDEIKAKSIYHYDDSYAESSTAISGSYLCSVTDDEDPSLRTISVSVGFDANGNSSLGGDEVDVVLITYIARLWPGS